jgi:two-component system nitrate/nitrite response regulator NarL
MAIGMVSGCPLRALGLQALAEAEGFPVAWIAPTAAEALCRVRRQPPAALLIDFALPDGSGPRLLHALRQEGIALDGFLLLADPHPAGLALAWKAGACAVLFTTLPLPLLRVRLRAALQGTLSWHPADRRRAQAWWVRFGEPWAALSPRQRAVALGVARGWSDKEIAQALRRRPTSIRTHLRWLLHRLGLPDRVALRQWVRSGCLDDPYIAPLLLLDLEDPPWLGEDRLEAGFLQK